MDNCDEQIKHINMKKLITILALLFAVTAMGQSFNKDKDKRVQDLLATKPLKAIKMVGTRVVDGYYELTYPNITIAVFYTPPYADPGIPETFEVNIVEIVNGKDRQEIVSNHSSAPPENRISKETLAKIKQRILLIK